MAQPVRQPRVAGCCAPVAPVTSSVAAGRPPPTTRRTRSQIRPSAPEVTANPPSASYGAARPAARSRSIGKGRRPGHVVEAHIGPIGCRRTIARTPGSCRSTPLRSGRADGAARRGPGPPARRRVNPPRPCRVSALHGPVPVQHRPVGPPVVGLVTGFGGPVRVVELTEFVAGPDDRDPTPAEHQVVRQQDPPERGVDGNGIAVGRRQAGQRRRGAADPPVAGGRVVLEHQPTCP